MGDCIDCIGAFRVEGQEGENALTAKLL